MRVAWVIYGSIEQATGGYIYDRLIVDGLRAHGIEVIVVEAGSALPDVDVVVGDGLCMPELAPLFERERGPLRVLLVHHLTSWETGTEIPLEKRALDAADIVIATSRATAARLGARVDVIVPGADRLPLLPRAPEENFLLGVGSLIARKRWHWVLEAMESLPGWTFQLVGDPDREPEYAATLRGAHVRGIVSDRELAEMFARASALVLPSSLEGYGMVLTEALRAGVPVLAAKSEATLEATRGCASFFESPDELRQILAHPIHQPAIDATWPRWSDAITLFKEALERRTAGARR